MKKVVALGNVRKFKGVEYEIVGVAVDGDIFPYEVWRDEEGRLCRFLHFLGYNFDIVEGMGTFIRGRGMERAASVLYNGYNKTSGIIKTDAGEIQLPGNQSLWGDFLKEVEDFERAIFAK